MYSIVYVGHVYMYVCYVYGCRVSVGVNRVLRFEVQRECQSAQGEGNSKCKGSRHT